MNTFIKKHQKKFLAVFSIGLMITFVASSGYGRGASHRSETVVGHIGKTAIYNTETEQARREWELLKNYVWVPRTNPYTQEVQRYPLLAAFYSDMGAELTAAMDDKPELFMLLRHEARAAGVRADNDLLQTILHNYVHRPASDDDTIDESLSEAVSDLLIINSNFERVSSDIKVSKPAVDQEVARQLQNIKLDVVELAASRFEATVPPPTAEQVKQHFDRYANVAPGTVTVENPFGFGYKFPDRVRIQYLTVNQGDIKKAVEASISPYDWDVKANLYYLQNQQNYPTTQAAAATTKPVAGPTTKPFAEVRGEVLDSVREPLVSKLMLDVQNRLTQGMQAAWTASSATTRPGIADLQQLAVKVSDEFHVPVNVTDLSNQDLTATELAALPGIGSAGVDQSSFANLVMSTVRPYLATGSKPEGFHTISKPSDVLFDLNQNGYRYRIVGASAAHPAPDVASVQSRINADLRTAAGYEKAKSTAQTLLVAGEKIGLNPAAVAAGQTMVTTDSFNGMPSGQILNVTLSDNARADFIRQAFGLLAKYDAAKQPNPLSIIEVPQDGRVFVVRLAEVTRPADVPVYMKQLQIGSELRGQLLRPFFMQWFNYDAVAKRNDYKPIASANAV